MVGSFFATSFIPQSFPSAFVCDDAGLPDDFFPDVSSDLSSDAYLFVDENELQHQLTVFDSVRIPSVEVWKVFAEFAIEEGSHGPYKFVMVEGAGLFVGLPYRDAAPGIREENLHPNIAQGAPEPLVEAAGYFMVGPHSEFVVSPIRSTRYPHAATGETFTAGLESYFRGEVEIISLQDMSPSVRKEFEKGLLDTALLRPRRIH